MKSFHGFINIGQPVKYHFSLFQYDIYYVGTPLPKEVTFTNLNDNIDVNFLENMCKSFGNIEDVKIYFHPRTKKHTGVGKVGLRDFWLIPHFSCTYWN